MKKKPAFAHAEYSLIQEAEMVGASWQVTQQSYCDGKGLTARRQTYVVMRLLHKLQEGRHIRPAEVIDGFQSSEHAPFAQSLEVVLANILKKRHSLGQTI